MHELSMFIIRVCLGGVFAYIITRLFRPDAGPWFIAGLAVFLVIMAYLLDFVRTRRQ